MRYNNRRLPFYKSILAGAFAALLALSSCSSDKSKNETTELEITAADAGDQPAKTSAATVGQTNVFLEVSGSMKGFMPPSNGGQITKFQATLDPLLATLQQNNQIGKKQFFEVREKIYPASYNQMAEYVRFGLKKTASSSSIPVMLDSIISNYSNPTGVNVFISDFIYAPAHGPAVSFVTTDIYRVLAKAQQQGQAVSIFAGTSDFKGTFYPAVKTAGKTIPNCCATEVPYYVWVIGKPQQVQLFNRQIMPGIFTDEVHIGFQFPAPVYSVLDKFMPVGDWYCNSPGNACHEITIADLKSSPVEMIVGLNLKGLPTSYTNEVYLKQNLKLEAANTDAAIKGIFTAAQFQTQKGVAGQNINPLKPYSHFVKIKLTKMVADDVDLQLTLQNQRPAWVQNRTTTNDSQINQTGGKTFQLAGMVAGVEQAYKSDNGDNAVFTAIIQAKKD